MKTPFFSLLCLLLLATASHARITESNGVYQDATGAKHPWSINSTHTLMWEDRPFVPVGGLFQVRSWSPQATDADFQSDIAAFEALKRKGVVDVYLQAARGGITGVKPAAIQRVIDYLDTEGITYGVSINDGPRDILAGYMVRPGAFRQEAPERGGVLRFAVEGLASSLYFIVSANGTDVVQSGEATMVAEGARVSVPALPGKYVVFLLPQKVYFPQVGGVGAGANATGMPNLWDGFDIYRDTLMAHLRQVKWGKGFRFFVDALPPNLSVSGEADKIIPTAEGFQSEWALWLSRRYKSVDLLRRAWSIDNAEPGEFSRAARLLPLWGGGKGLQALYDRKTSEVFKVDTLRSYYWRDLSAFKAETIRGYMNDLATSLKRGVADVPVIYRSRSYSDLFTNLPARGGFDGVGIDAYGRGADLVTSSAGYVYAQAAEAPKTLWLPVTGTQETSLVQEKAAKGYASRFALHADLDWLREIGARGFYVDGVRIAENSRKNFDLSDMPEQLGWLSDYARMLVATGVGTAGTPPKVVFYPRDLPQVSVRPLQSGGWWLPTSRSYFAYDFGDMGRAYSMTDPDGGVVYYLWNPKGPKRIKIPVGKRPANAPPIIWSAHADGELKGGKTLTLTVGPDPVRIVNLPNLPVPEGTFEAMSEEAKVLQAALRKRNSVDAGRYQMGLAGMDRRYESNRNNPMPDILEMQKLLMEMRELLAPYAWLEAEGTARQAVSHSFDEVSARSGASNLQVLSVDPRPEGAPSALATYGISVKDSGPYNLWVAASPGTALTFRLNGQPLEFENSAIPQPIGKPYANGTLVWHRYGVASLPRGGHLLEMRANSPGTVDVILLTREEFIPDGPVRPPIKP